MHRYILYITIPAVAAQNVAVTALLLVKNVTCALNAVSAAKNNNL